MLRGETGSKKQPEEILSDKPYITTYESDLRTRLSTFPYDAQGWYCLGCHLHHEHRLQEAEESLRKAIRFNTKPIHFWSELAAVLSTMGRHEEASSILQRIGEDTKQAVGEDLHKTRSLHRLRDIRGTSPCIDCQDYTYYGCSRGEPCGRFVVWRSGMSR
ncbi:MAG: tetratricopeptide repeat protein [Candidatus Thorarchaeota archaeon]